MQCEKTVIHIPKLRVGQYLLVFDISYYLKISQICGKFLLCFGIKNPEMLKIWELDFNKDDSNKNVQ